MEVLGRDFPNHVSVNMGLVHVPIFLGNPERGVRRCGFDGCPQLFAQQTMAHYEGGTLRIAVALLSPLSSILGMSFEELIDSSAKRANSKRGPAPKLQQQLEQLSRLPKAKQRLVSQVIESVLAQADR